MMPNKPQTSQSFKSSQSQVPPKKVYSREFKPETLRQVSMGLRLLMKPLDRLTLPILSDFCNTAPYAFQYDIMWCVTNFI
jgi:hypothetical protein